MLIVHHLGISQSERIVWLCEELGVEYQLVLHTRNPVNLLSPLSLTSIPGNALGAAPIIQDGSLTLAESGAIAEYIIHKYGGGRLILSPDHPNYTDYLYWFHHANGGLQACAMRVMYIQFAKTPDDNPVKIDLLQRFDKVLRQMDKRLEKTSKYLAGDEFTVADIMSGFTLVTGRYFVPMSFKPFPNIVAYLGRIGERPAYRRAMAKGDKGLELPLGADMIERSPFPLTAKL